MRRSFLSFAIVSLFSMRLLAADAIPLEMGNYWIYRDLKSSQTFSIQVGQPVWTQTGKQFHYLVGYAPSPVLARISEAGDLVALDPETGLETVLTALSAKSGEWWDAPSRECLTQGQTREGASEYAGPAGRWRTAVQVLYRGIACADAGPVSESFVGNIGMVSRTISTIAGPRSYDLVYARVGNQIIETRDRGRFSVAVEPTTTSGPIRATLRIDIGYHPALALRFNSAQEFDVALRDESGRVVWLWSDGKLFEPGEREKRIGNVWAEAVEIPRPSGTLLGYTVEAWLATAPGAPKFAATAPVPPSIE